MGLNDKLKAFVKGIGSILDIMPDLKPAKFNYELPNKKPMHYLVEKEGRIYLIEEHPDVTALRKDFEAVGKDMRKVMY